MRDKQASEVDKYVGQMVRNRRVTLGYSQGDLGKALNLTFQQIQKYEKGINRIPAGRLYLMASILGVDIAYFFPKGQPAMTEFPDFVPTPEEIVLCKQLRAVSKAVREAITHLTLIQQVRNDRRDQEDGAVDPLEQPRA